jgi:hydroxyacylglutathione hydrolase
MKIHALVVGEFEVNCWILESDGKGAIVIDPGSDSEKICGFLRKHRLTPTAYLLTHGHVDHVSAVADVYAAFPATVAIHKADLAWAFDEVNAMPPFYPAPARPPGDFRLLEDRQEWTDAGLTYNVIATPGHTPGCVCFHFKTDSALFSGDTLFAGSVGRTDLPGGDSRMMGKSLELLKKLPDNTMVYTGHGPETDIGREKATNYFMRGGI